MSRAIAPVLLSPGRHTKSNPVWHLLHRRSQLGRSIPGLRQRVITEMLRDTFPTIAVTPQPARPSQGPRGADLWGGVGGGEATAAGDAAHYAGQEDAEGRRSSPWGTCTISPFERSRWRGGRYAWANLWASGRIEISLLRGALEV